MNIAMIPARMDSQRHKKTNLRKLRGIPLLTRAIHKCKEVGVFDEIWVNSEDKVFGAIAVEEGVNFHERPPELANDTATSEQFVYEFFTKHPCDRMFQVHSIAPLGGAARTAEFVHAMENSDYDVLLSCTLEQIECDYEDAPINFSYSDKTNSQELKSIQRVTWSITGWRRATFVDAFEGGKTGTCAAASARAPGEVERRFMSPKPAIPVRLFSRPVFRPRAISALPRSNSSSRWHSASKRYGCSARRPS